jgi:hypothetical protein
LLGKPPGSKEDYRILHGTVGLTHDRAWAGVPSTPQFGGLQGPGRLPWVTFTPRAVDGQYRMAVTVIDTTDDRDSVGRAVVSIRYAELPFTELARGDLSLQAIYQAMPLVSAMKAADPARSLALDIGSTESPAARILAVDTAAFDRAAGMAALLLSGEVVIELGDTDAVPLAARLAEFDRVLALVPFGVRASAALASWHDGAQSTAYRLAFGERALRGQAVGHAGPVPAPEDHSAAAYLSDLLLLREQCGAARMLAHLRSHRWPQERPVGPRPGLPLAEEAHQILRELADPGLVLAAVRGGRASPGHVATATALAGDRLDRATLSELEGYLLAQGGSVAGQSVLSGWSASTATRAGTLARGDLAQLAEGEQSGIGWRLRAYAARKGTDDEFLAALAAEHVGSSGPVPPARIAVALDARPPERGELPFLRDAVLSSHALARAILHLALRRNQGSERRWLGWLGPLAADAPGWLRQYAVLAGSRNSPLPLPASGADAAEPDDRDEDLALIAWLAGRTGSLAWLADEWWPLLFTMARSWPQQAQSGQDGRPERDALASQGAGSILADLVRAPLRSRRTLTTDVRSDTLLLYCGLPPAGYPVTGRAADCRAYLAALRDAWSAQPAKDDADILTARLLTGVFCSPPGFPREAPRGEPALVLLRAVVSDRAELAVVVANAIAEVLQAAPYLYADPGLSQDWWVSVERIRPDVRTPMVRLRAAVGAPVADPTDVAVLIGRAAAAGDDYAEIAGIVGGWFARYPAGEQRAIFRVVQAVAELAASRRRASAGDLADLAARLGLPRPKPSSSFLGRPRRSG